MYDFDWLLELGKRLVKREVYDGAELLAHRANFDDELLFAAADHALKRASRGSRSQEPLWTELAAMLDEAAIVSLRRDAHGASPYVPSSSQIRPKHPYITVDIGFVEGQVDHQGDFRALLEELLKWTYRALLIAGESAAFEEVKDDVTAVLHSEQATNGDLIRAIGSHINLR